MTSFSSDTNTGYEIGTHNLKEGLRLSEAQVFVPEIGKVTIVSDAIGRNFQRMLQKSSKRRFHSAHFSAQIKPAHQRLFCILALSTITFHRRN